MTDIRLVQNTAFPAYSVTEDWSLLQDGTLDTDQQLATAVIVALGTNGLAARDDLLPDPDSTDRMGWWGDLDAEALWGGWPIGCKLWLLKRSKIEGPGSFYGSTVVRVENYIIDAIRPFIDRRIASDMSVVVRRTERERIEAIVRLYRGPRLAVELRYEILWTDIIEA
jgi:phage gp46-like protein